MTNDLAAITCFFSYVKNPYAIKRYKEFSQNLERQGVKLYTVELAFNDEDFLLDDDVYLRLRSDTVLWHKEALLNLLVKRLPPHVKKVAWLDADIFINDDNWVNKASHALEEYELVQMGEEFNFLKESTLNSGNWDTKERSSMKTIGWAYINEPSKKCDFKYHHVGLGWAAKRAFFENVGLFDYDVTGTGDTITYFSSAGLMQENETAWVRDYYKKNSPSILPHLEEYKKKAYNFVQGKVSYLDTVINHRYHCPVKRRGYYSRMDLLKGINYKEDLVRDKNHLFEWKNKSMNKPFEIFFSRKDTHVDQKCEYYNIDKYYETT